MEELNQRKPRKVLHGLVSFSKRVGSSLSSLSTTVSLPSLTTPFLFLCSHTTIRISGKGVGIPTSRYCKCNVNPVPGNGPAQGILRHGDGPFAMGVPSRDNWSRDLN